MNDLTPEQQKEMAEIMAELAKQLGISPAELLGQCITKESPDDWRPENN